MSYLVDAVEMLDSIPQDFKYNLSQITTTDLRVHNLEETIEKKKQRLFAAAGSMPDQRRLVADIDGDYERAINLTQDKVQLANANLDTINRVCRFVALKVEKFQAELESANPGVTRKLEKRTSSIYETASVHQDEDNDSYDAVTPAASSSRRRGARKRQHSDAEVTPLKAPVAEPVPVEAVDNEVYCICKQVSFGDMIACENAECPIEWYHFKCVGLETEPVDKWYCPLCRGKMNG